MMRHFDMKRYSRKRGKKFIHYFGVAIIQGGDYSRGGYYSRKYGTHFMPKPIMRSPFTFHKFLFLRHPNTNRMHTFAARNCPIKMI